MMTTKSKMYIFSVLTLVSIVGMILTSCTQPAERKDKVTYSRIVGMLEAKGFSVEILDTLKQPFFNVDARVFEVEGDNLQIFEYAEESDAEEDAKLVSASGTSIGTSMVSWISSPHFFQRQKLIAIYVGDNKEIISALESLLGKQFAGNEIPPIKTEITNFEECAAAGNPIMESMPRQCKADGKTFVEELRIVEDGVVSKISSDKGKLILSYKDGKARLSGELFRGTPCVSWKVVIGGTKDMPRSEVDIRIYDENKDKGMICIQVVAEPQVIDEEILSVSAGTNYNIQLEGKTIFSGKIGEAQ